MADMHSDHDALTHSWDEAWAAMEADGGPAMVNPQSINLTEERRSDLPLHEQNIARHRAAYVGWLEIGRALHAARDAHCRDAGRLAEEMERDGVSLDEAHYDDDGHPLCTPLRGL